MVVDCRNIAFPYGLKNSLVSKESLHAMLSTRLIILLGTEDNDPDHPSLRVTPEAMAQGAHRYQRGHSFYNAAKALAQKNTLSFDWHIAYAPGVGHNNGLMAGFALPIIVHTETVDTENVNPQQ